MRVHLYDHYLKMDSNWFSIRVKWVQGLKKLKSGKGGSNDKVFFFISIGWYILSFSKSCFGHADEKKKEKGGTKRVRVRITGRPGKLRHTPRCSGIHQVSPATTQSAKPLTIPILPSKNLSSTNAPTRPQTPGPMFCHRARVQSRSFVRSFVHRQFSFVGGRDVSLLFWQIEETRVAS